MPKLISIPFEIKSEGGGNYVIDQISSYLIKKDFEVDFNFNYLADVLFLNSWQADYRDLKKFKHKNSKAKIIHRLDGIAQLYGRQDSVDKIAKKINRFADITIYQSEFIKKEFLNLKLAWQDGPIIYNPVNSKLFCPTIKRNLSSSLTVGYLTWSTNKLKGFEDLYQTIIKNPLVNFKLIGNYPDLPKLDNVESLGVLSRDQIPNELNKLDALLTFSENEACPNHVLEAMSCAKPILYKNSGSMKEIIADCGFEVDPNSFQRIINDKKNEFVRVGLKARQRVIDIFDSEIILEKYRKIIDNG